MQAKQNQQDEFFTIYEDIEKEMNAYLEYNPNVFRDKVVLLPCDDPDWSNFTKYFAQNFERLGLKKLISTSYAQNNKSYAQPLQLSLFEINSPKYDEKKTDSRGKLFTLTRQNKTVDISDLHWEYLDGDGDFRSKEVKELRNESDIIITNPPFSLFREFLEWILEADKQFAIIGSINIISYGEVFPRIKSNEIWLGTGMGRWISGFIVPPDYKLYGTEAQINEKGQRIVATNNCLWLTNIDHGKRHEKVTLMTMADNLKFSRRKKIQEQGYPKYVNYDAIEVAYSEAIPSDYDGICGVPITWLGKYNPEEYDIIGLGNGREHFTPNFEFENPKSYTKNGKVSKAGMLNRVLAYEVDDKPEKGTYYTADNVEGYLIAPYARILIRKK
ncbi:DNA methyltransferase [Salibacterium salarium]|uniref:DNA methyltransferase n=1 Tax=Salibacterium salarium TaxID=284579 RepID=A0A3R9R802_9BACI|nr:adenine-specific methyltransferase EcoRI family protein [Salibacterium salarium]RSL29216.1 DNA methyltransferase [Salibacterium salarium]